MRWLVNDGCCATSGGGGGPKSERKKRRKKPGISGRLTLDGRLIFQAIFFHAATLFPPAVPVQIAFGGRGPQVVAVGALRRPPARAGPERFGQHVHRGCCVAPLLRGAGRRSATTTTSLQRPRAAACRVWKWNETPRVCMVRGDAGEAQTECPDGALASSPRLARQRLAWVIHQPSQQPQRGCVHSLFIHTGPRAATALRL